MIKPSMSKGPDDCLTCWVCGACGPSGGILLAGLAGAAVIFG